MEMHRTVFRNNLFSVQTFNIDMMFAVQYEHRRRRGRPVIRHLILPVLLLHIFDLLLLLFYAHVNTDVPADWLYVEVYIIF